MTRIKDDDWCWDDSQRLFGFFWVFVFLIVFVFKSVSSVSIRVKHFLQKVVADEFEGVLAGPPADAFAVAGEVELFDLGVLGVGEGDVDEADWLVGVGAGSSGARAGDAGDRDAERC